MSLIDCLTEAELKNIQTYINACADGVDKTSISIDEVPYILRMWNEDKEDLFNLFGGKLILSKPFSCSIGTEQLYEDIERILKKYWKIVGWKSISTKLNTTKYNEVFQYFFDHPEIYINNKIDRNFEFNNETFPVGMKPMRILHKILQYCEVPEEDYESMRIAISQLTNQRSLKGNLCLSIHPLDYMTMSDNAENWHSCMSWENHGEFRMGTVEMMNSACVIVAYLASANHDYVLNDFSWNSKKWRELFIVKDGFISEIKSYPYISGELTDECLRWLKELYDNTDKTPLINRTQTILGREKDSVIEDEDGSVLRDNFLMRVKTNYMYNDYYGKHKSYISCKMADGGRPSFAFISGTAECMLCGESVENVDLPNDRLVCYNCAPSEYVCCNCGTYLNCDNAYYSAEDDCYCYDCYCKYFFDCRCCGQGISKDEAAHINIRYEGEIIRENLADLCADCLNRHPYNFLVYNSETNCYNAELRDIYERLILLPTRRIHYDNQLTIDSVSPLLGLSYVSNETVSIMQDLFRKYLGKEVNIDSFRIYLNLNERN